MASLSCCLYFLSQPGKGANMQLGHSASTQAKPLAYVYKGFVKEVIPDYQLTVLRVEGT